MLTMVGHFLGGLSLIWIGFIAGAVCSLPIGIMLGREVFPAESRLVVMFRRWTSATIRSWIEESARPVSANSKMVAKEEPVVVNVVLAS